MRSNIGNIIRKELSRFFGDKRLFMNTILMPGLMIYIMYSLMGNVMAKALTTSDDYMFQVAAVNLPQELQTVLEQSNCEITVVEEGQLDAVKQEIVDKNKDICVVFPEQFMEEICSYDVASGQEAPEVQMYYLSTETNSSGAYSMMESILEELEQQMSNRFDINVSDDEFDLATDSDLTGKMVSMLMPMLLMILLFNGCVAIAPDSIAGEKERGTIATLLVTPVKRSEIAIGKIVSLSIITLLSGLSSFLGIMLSLPSLVGGLDEMNTNVYSMGDYVMLLLIVLSTVLFMISMVAVLSALASSVKEAGTLISPFSILIAVIGIAGMFTNGASKKIALYLVPLLNSAQCMNGIFSFQFSLTCVVVTVVSNLVYSIALVVVLTRMFESEKIMFSK